MWHATGQRVAKGVAGSPWRAFGRRGGRDREDCGAGLRNRSMDRQRSARVEMCGSREPRPWRSGRCTFEAGGMARTRRRRRSAAMERKFERQTLQGRG